MLDMGQLLTSCLVVEEPNYFPKLFLGNGLTDGDWVQKVGFFSEKG